MNQVRIIGLITWLVPFLSVLPQITSYSWNCKTETVADSGWYAIELPPHVLSGCESGFNDIRVYRLDRDTVEVPFLLRTASAMAEEDSIPCKILNAGQDPATGLFEFTIRLEDRKTINHIKMNFVEDNFDGEVVSVEGSFNQTEWVVVSRDQRITSFDNGDIQYRYTVLSFNDCNYVYYRIRIRNAPRFGKVQPLHLKSAAVHRFIKRPAAMDTLTAVSISVSADRESRSTQVLIDLDNIRIVDRIVIGADFTSDYFRRFSIEYVADSVKIEDRYEYIWVAFGSGLLSSWESPTHVDGHARTHRLRIRIFNGDDQPLSVAVTRIMALTRSLVCRMSPGAHYVVVYGRSNDRAPQYDLVNYQDKIPDELMKLGLKLPERTVLQGGVVFFVTRNWIWLAMTVAIAIMVIFGVQMYRESVAKT